MTENASASSRNLFFLLLLTCLVTSGCSQTVENPPEKSETQSTTGNVSVTIDFADAPAFVAEAIPIREGATVLDVMNKLKANSDETKFDFEHSGSGETAFLKSINAVENEGAAGKSWMYKVNDKKADRGFGVFKLSKDDKILWEFKKYEQ